ncbi:hypothetical protein BJ973_001875 [Actinoplanes tereljensis]|uniref:Uncharacterized protein n=1 Tax=Paractinoplanes tereljensis TaxID=571912 RepID=A0A919NL78_9ACTN|nr:hypothetical protein [Actinoplanes tereljensis]GIF20218.1 hypothetical protein Ate02nite_29480 [Actinoplanes tereljensis]
MTELFAVRATAHRIAALAGREAAVAVLAEHDGWCRLRTDPQAVGAATRAAAFALHDEPELTVTGYRPDGEVAHGGEAALPGGGALLRQALVHDEPRYTAAARLTDACRALGVPPELLLDRPPRHAPLPVPRSGLVLVGLDPAAAAADAVLTGQSSWTVPFTPKWSLHLWDGAGRPTPYTTAAYVLAGRNPAVALWWSAREAGLLVVHGSKLVAGHQWGDWAPITPESTAEAGRVLAADFGVPDQALSLTALLRRRDLAPTQAMTSLVALLGLPDAGLGRRSADALAAWSAGVLGAVRTPHKTGLAAIRHAVREAR